MAYLRRFFVELGQKKITINSWFLDLTDFKLEIK